jgi:hypothetical protein
MISDLTTFSFWSYAPVYISWKNEWRDTSISYGHILPFYFMVTFLIKRLVLGLLSGIQMQDGHIEKGKT